MESPYCLNCIVKLASTQLCNVLVQVLHDGGVVNTGHKFILRADVMYGTRVSPATPFSVLKAPANAFWDLCNMKPRYNRK